MKTFHQGLSLWIAVWTLVWPSSTTTSFFGSFPSGGVAAQTVEWGGCEDPVDGAKKVTIGEKTTVCLTIADGTNWTESRQYIRVNFQPIADEYSRFAIPQCTFLFSCFLWLELCKICGDSVFVLFCFVCYG